jgi:transcriptional regulator with XRE-family HTH domain
LAPEAWSSDAAATLVVVSDDADCGREVVNVREARIDPGLWLRPDMSAALASRDIAAVYRLLQRVGVSQRRIAAMTGQSQSEISEILAGRRVAAYDVLVRIADGLAVPRGRMGLACNPDGSTAVDDSWSRPALDPDSGRWVVRLPVYVDSYDLALGLCESAVRSELTSDWGTRSGRDDIAALRWRGTASAVLGSRGNTLRRVI